MTDHSGSSARAVSQGAAARVGPTESQFQRAVVEAATLHGWRHCHTRRATVRSGRVATPTSVPGWPDLVLWDPQQGGVLFVELKTDTGALTPQQTDVLQSLKDAGADVRVWRPRDWDEIKFVLRGWRATNSPTGGAA